MIPAEMDLSGRDLTTEVVRTERLVLRPHRPDDADAVLFGRLPGDRDGIAR